MLWGGRFSKELNKGALEFSSSLPDDINLIDQDIRVSVAHTNALAKQGLISVDEAAKIVSALKAILKEFDEKLWQPLQYNYEDIHSAIEARLAEKIGVTAGKLHTGRSRNDQVAADMRLWVKENSALILDALRKMQSVLLSIAEKHVNSIIPGYTHLQRAQPVSLAFILLAYVEMLERDKKRFADVIQISDVCPLGSGAMAGSSLPLDRDQAADELGFLKISGNSYDAVSDRDFVLDFLHSCSTGMIHLSRLCEELIIWSSAEWKLVKLSDEFTTGSSLMPQKKNPDMAELIRGKTGRVIGNENGFKATLKGLPMSYNRDLQEDKRPMFDSFNTYYSSLMICAGMLETAEFLIDKWPLELQGDFSLATDIADWLVNNGIPFREAHNITGQVVKFAEANNKKLHQLSLTELQSIYSLFNETALPLMNIESALVRKQTAGSPNPAMLLKQIDSWKQKNQT